MAQDSWHITCELRLPTLVLSDKAGANLINRRGGCKGSIIRPNNSLPTISNCITDRDDVEFRQSLLYRFKQGLKTVVSAKQGYTYVFILLNEDHYSESNLDNVRKTILGISLLLENERGTFILPRFSKLRDPANYLYNTQDLLRSLDIHWIQLAHTSWQINNEAEVREYTCDLIHQALTFQALSRDPRYRAIGSNYLDFNFFHLLNRVQENRPISIHHGFILQEETYYELVWLISELNRLNQQFRLSRTPEQELAYRLKVQNLHDRFRAPGKPLTPFFPSQEHDDDTPAR
jgi:hypothetical protein